MPSKVVEGSPLTSVGFGLNLLTQILSNIKNQIPKEINTR